MSIRGNSSQFRAHAFVAVLAIVSCTACVPLRQVVANCEVRGQLRMEGSDAPVENVMIFARYNFKASSVQPIVVGPILSDSTGRFVIPAFYRSHWYIEHLYMGSCGGDLLFVHPTLGSYSVLMCTEDFPPSLPYKELNVVQYGAESSFAKTYGEIDSLPRNLQGLAWAHVDPERRRK